jgi:hypothetical protein
VVQNNIGRWLGWFSAAQAAEIILETNSGSHSHPAKTCQIDFCMADEEDSSQSLDSAGIIPRTAAGSFAFRWLPGLAEHIVFVKLQ